MDVTPPNVSVKYENIGLFETESSLNKIYSLQEKAFFKLNNLKFLYIYENCPNMTINNGSFYELNKIESIYLSKSILNSETISIFIGLLQVKNKNNFKKILNVNYIKSLNLISFNETDCNLTLYFIKENVHFNLRTENDWYKYISNCDGNEIHIKNKVSNKNDYLTRIQLTNYWIFYLAVTNVTISILFFVYFSLLLCCT